jgi:hypothetical protein
MQQQMIDITRTPFGMHPLHSTPVHHIYHIINQGSNTHSSKKSPRNIRPSSKLNNFYTIMAELECEPLTYMEAAQDLEWQTAIQSEIDSITKNNT